MRLLLLALSILSAQAVTITVCASGCTTTSFQTALDTAVGGDTIKLTGGETFEGTFSLPYRSDGGNVLVIGSRDAELPTAGRRVTVADAARFPKVMATNGTDPVLTAGYVERVLSSVDLGTDTLTFTASHGIPNGSPIACRVDGAGTAPITAYTVYYASNVSGATMKVAATQGEALAGQAINLTTAITGSPTIGCTRNDAIHGYTFRGIEFSGKVGAPSQYFLVNLFTEAFDRAGIIRDIHFDRVYIHGIQTENGAKNCLLLNTKTSSVVDSRIEFCQREGEESHAIVSYLTPGPLLIRNNYISAASINILFGGNYVYVPQLVNGDEGGIGIFNNHFHKPLYLKYRSGPGGTGVPAAACSDGEKYIRTTTGLVYTCASNVWSVDATCANDEYFRRTDVTQDCPSGACWKCAAGVYIADTVYRSTSYFVKNNFEIKSAKNVRVRGNVFENNWAGNGDQSGIAVWITSQVAQGNGNTWVRGEDIVFEHNWIKNTALGLRVASEGVTTFGIPNNRISVQNNAGLHIGLTQFGTINDSGSFLQVGGRCEDCTWDHNSSYPGGQTNGAQFDTAATTRLRFANNLVGKGVYGVRGDAGGDCTGITTAPGVIDGDDLLIRNILVDQLSTGGLGSIGACATDTKYIAAPWSDHLVDGPGGNLRLKTTSPYSAACASGCDFPGTDGKDLGVDQDIVDSLSQGAVSGLPWLGGSINVTAGSTRAIVRYTAPSAAVCTLKLYTNLARTTLHADTDTGGEQSDDRAGNVSSGTSRQFVLGTVALTASTPYWAVITCGTSIGYVPFRTVAAGSGFNAVIRYPSAITGEYSSSATMSSPTAISSSATHTVPLAAGVVRYYRATGGAIQAFVAP